MTPIFTTSRNCECVLNRPSFADTHVQGGPFNSCSFRPFGQGEIESVMCVPFGNTTVSDLSGPRGPAHVGRFVIAVVVNSIQRHLRVWANTNVRVERFKRITPAVTHDDPASTVVLKCGIVRVCCALLNSCPNVVFRRMAKSMRCHVFAHGSLSRFRVQTTARPGISTPQVGAVSKMRGTTITDASPFSLIRVVRKCAQSAKALICEINQFAGDFARSFSFHLNSIA